MKGLYLAISLTTRCNLSCFYCKPTGESISEQTGDLSFDDFQRIVHSAYLQGINKFRLTGGECSLVPYFEDAVHFIMELGSDVRINICSNGFLLPKFFELFKEYKDRINVRISVDSLQKELNGVTFPKYLSHQIESIVQPLLKIGIKTRFNIVVTSYNFCELEKLIKRSLSIGVDIKLLDLYIQDVYLGESRSSMINNPKKFWQTTYVSLTQIKPFLEKICDTYIDNFDEDSAFGIPMRAYKYKNQAIILKDSSKGAHFSKICKKGCKKYLECQEGIYVPFVSVGGVLHINGCRNEKLRWNLSNMTNEAMQAAFREVLALFDDLEVCYDSSISFCKHLSNVENKV
ncbi:MAG: radical SAM protein [Prevotellaceae bacterium]|jgi:MoaA/NifB/PqqE/SkfB family radical SAM enzyme|nr:radical SAM protein [Prevotellaceae bacterium]